MIPLIKPIFPKLETYANDIEKMYESGMYSNDGQFCQSLESKLAKRINCKHAILITNGTIALYAALMYYNFEKGSKILVPNFTFAATVQAIHLCGLEPVYADIDSETLTISVEEVEHKINQVSAVLAVNSFGNPCHYMEIKDLCRKNKVPFIVDAAGSYGANYLNFNVGTIGDIECFSLHATKVLPMGEGGLITTNNDDIAAFIRRFKNFGLDGSIVKDKFAMNAKVDELRCIVCLAALKQLDAHLDNRLKYVKQYKKGLKKCKVKFIQPSGVVCYETNQLFPVMFESTEIRDKVMEKLNEKEIGSKVYYTPFDSSVRLKVTDDVYGRILCLPMHSVMTNDDISMVCNAIQEII